MPTLSAQLGETHDELLDSVAEEVAADADSLEDVHARAQASLRPSRTLPSGAEAQLSLF